MKNLTKTLAVVLFLTVIMAPDASTQTLMRENAEGPGFSADWSEILVEGCNAINPDFVVPFAPPHWGEESLGILTCEPWQAVLVRSLYAPVLPSTITHFQAAILEDDVAADDFTMIAAAKDNFGPAWMVHLFGSDDSDHIIRIGVGETWARIKRVETYEIFDIHIIYSPPQARVFWNGEDLGQIILTPEDAQFIHANVIGNSSSSSGYGSIVVIDNYTFSIF